MLFVVDAKKRYSYAMAETAEEINRLYWILKEQLPNDDLVIVEREWRIENNDDNAIRINPSTLSEIKNRSANKCEAN